MKIVKFLIFFVVWLVVFCLFQKWASEQQKIQRRTDRIEMAKFMADVRTEEIKEARLDEEFRHRILKVREESEKKAETQILIQREAQAHLDGMQVNIPYEVIQHCEYYGKEYGVSPELLESICWWESRCTPTASNGSCKGIMQISEGCHKERMKRLGVTSIYDLRGNIRVGADYLSELFEMNNNIIWVLLSYNGDSRADSYAEQNKMTPYAKKIIELAEILERAHGI